ncbi:MAG: DUF5777 family beta-barrel protein [Spirosomataceae bacterium]
MKNNSSFLQKLFFFLLLSNASIGQDLLDELDKNIEVPKQFSIATFKSTRVINGHSVETMAKKHLDFRIAHRFGTLGNGAYELWGLDNATMRISLEYGLTDRLMVGVSRSSLQKTYDYLVKYKLVRQTTEKGSPVSITAIALADAITLESSPSFQFYRNIERFSYVGQLLIARKMNENLSLQLSPTLLHRNSVEDVGEANTWAVLGVSGRMKLTKRTSINGEYFYRVPLENGRIGVISPTSLYRNSLSIGFDIETGGHVFQLHFTNSVGMVERQFLVQTDGRWLKGDVHYGFNISRTFSFDKKNK